ncbi:MAG: RNA polymerase factor sigma-54 [Acidobacteriota bacterium]
MALEQKLTLRLSQRLIMTPALQQAIKLLQMSKLELLNEVGQELVDNPALEETNLENTTPEGSEETTGERDEERDQPERDEELDYEVFQDYLDASWVPAPSRVVREDLPSFENTLSKPQDLSDHLLWQLNLSSYSERLREVARSIIGNIDEDGYLVATTEEVRAMDDYSEEEVEEAAKIVQSFDPVGVGARNLRECLLLQLHHFQCKATHAETIVREHLELVQFYKYDEIARRLGCSVEEARHHVDIIRRLDPKPGQKYSNQEPRYVVPDVYVLKVDRGEYTVVLNEEGLPRLRISPVYRRMLAAGPSTMSREAKEFVREKFRSAFRLIKSLEERQRTIYKVAHSIVRHQKDFLDYGIEKMRPLVLRDVADDIQMHESTISRVVNNKFMHTPRGVFEMRFFFHSGLPSMHGQDISSLSVKQTIKKMIGAENPQHPLSDSVIAKMLENDGLRIARRTVAKYREELRIPSSTDRRRQLSRL